MNSKIILTLFIAFIMITSVIGFIWSSGSGEETYEVIEYNGYEFKNINGRYLVEVNSNEYVFDNSPYEVGDIDIGNFNLESDKYYILFTPNEKDLNMEYAMQKLYLVLNSLGVKVQSACSTEEECDPGLPIKSCEDYSFYFIRGDSAKVYKDNNCVVIEGDNEGMDNGVDKINMKLLGI